MYACLLLLALVIAPSAPQQQTETVDQKLVALSEWLVQWKTVELETLHTLLEYRVSDGNLAVAIGEVVDQVIQNVTGQLLLQCNSSQLLIDLQILKGRQAVSGAV